MDTKKANDIPTKRKIHVGGISKELAENIADLETRFGKIGPIIEHFDIHSKPVLDYYFGYITMKLSNNGYLKVKKMWDGVKFKGSMLKISPAKDNYTDAWKHDSKRQDDKKLARRKRDKIAESRKERIENRNLNPFKVALVTKGRLRKTPRKTDLKNLTIRIKINGRLKVIKCKKNKLWGIAKNKSIRDLTNRFIAGEWRDGNDHVIDRLTTKVIIFGDKGITVEDAQADGKNEVEEEFNNELEKNNKVLEYMLDKYNFDQPVELENDENDGEKGNFDYELEHEDDEDELNLTYNIPEKQCIHPSRESIINDYKEHENTVLKNDNGSVEDEDDDDFYKNLKADPELESNHGNPEASDSKTKPIPSLANNDASENIAENPVEVLRNDVEDSEEDEFIPTFGKPTTTDASKNTTEQLRDILNFSSSTHKLINEEENVFKEDTQPDPFLKKNENIGLFFSHFDSPFLVAQTQINKLREININEELNYDDWFWKNRGELNREFRKLRRDVMRRNKKKDKTSALI